MDEIDIRIEVKINPTEDPQKVRKAVENIFGPLKTQIKPLEQGELLIAENKGIDGLRTLHDLLERYRIRDAARTVLNRGLRNNVIIFHLNKQVAYVGHLSFSNPAREVARKIEKPFNLELIRTLRKFKSKYGITGYYFDYNLAKSDFTKVKKILDAN